MVRVLDASAVVQFFRERPGYEEIRQLFVDAAAEKVVLLMTSVNWGEVRYTLVHFFGSNDLLRIEKALASLPIRIIDVNQDIVSWAGNFKLKYKIGYCDAIAAALAKLYKAECIATDSDFNLLKDEIKVHLIK